ncbi:MAG: TIGR00341 family protein [Chitinophagaceae bacterium]|nr:TIGR00341 family protein [Chitinophagaceae bacterium]
MNWFQKIFNIKTGTDYQKTDQTITDGIGIKGANVWLMICSALLASIGLDTNSTAVIIGAMLISPLMSPILGVGYSIGIHDKEIFIHAIRNLAYATFFSLLTAFVYFLITPLGQPTSEILARTQPTLLDIGVAFFGGVAGIVSLSRKETTIALPGVAIATALMPPICVAGFGLATGRWEIFGGAFYLFFINSAFIATSTYLIVRLLKFPIKDYVEKGKQKRVARYAIVVLILVSVPSLWFLYTVYQNNRTQQVIKTEIINDFRLRGNEILKWETEDRDSVIVIKTFFSGSPVSEDDRLYYEKKLKKLGLSGYDILFYQMNISKLEMDKMGSEMTRNIMKNIELQNSNFRDSLQQVYRNIDEGMLYEEVKSFYPNIFALGIGPLEMKSAAKTDSVWAAYLQWDTLAEKVNKEEAVKNIREYLKKRLKTDTVWLQQFDQQKIKR